VAVNFYLYDIPKFNAVVSLEWRLRTWPKRKSWGVLVPLYEKCVGVRPAVKNIVPERGRRRKFHLGSV